MVRAATFYSVDNTIMLSIITVTLRKMFNVTYAVPGVSIEPVPDLRQFCMKQEISKDLLTKALFVRHATCFAKVHKDSTRTLGLMK